MISTYFALMAEYDTPHIPLEKVALKYWNLSTREACRRAALQQLPCAVFRGSDSQKAGWFVDARDLANHIDDQRRAAKKHWDAMQDIANLGLPKAANG